MEKKYEIQTDNLIALCNIIDDFKDFEENLIPLLSSKHYKNFILQLYNVSKGNFVLGANKAKKFYKERKEIIDIINKYSNILMFINLNYEYNGKSNENFQFFYKYIILNKKEIKQIIELLLKLKELGFDKLEFNENINFSKETYELSQFFDRNICFNYVANPQIIPSYSNYINFKTTDSNYKIELKFKSITNKQISECNKKIIVNSLLFDSITLPKKIDKENIFDQIVNIKNNQKEKDEILKELINLNMTILDLETQISSVNSVIKGLKKLKNKEELIVLLTSINENIKKLKELNLENENIIYNEESLLTPELIEKEKKLYLRRKKIINKDSY